MEIKFSYEANEGRYTDSELLLESYKFYGDALDYLYEKPDIVVEKDGYKIRFNYLEFEFDVKIDDAKADLNFILETERKDYDEDTLYELIRKAIRLTVENLNEQLATSNLTKIPYCQYIYYDDGHFFIRVDGQKNLEISYCQLFFETDAEDDKVDDILSDIQLDLGL